MSASQIDRAGEQLVCREGAADIDVGHDAVGSPSIGRTAFECGISAVGSRLHFPKDWEIVSFVVELVGVHIKLLRPHVEVRLIPEPAFCIFCGFAGNVVVTGVVDVITLTVVAIGYP